MLDFKVLSELYQMPIQKTFYTILLNVLANYVIKPTG